MYIVDHNITEVALANHVHLAIHAMPIARRNYTYSYIYNCVT